MATDARSTAGSEFRVKVGTSTTYDLVAEVYDFNIQSGGVKEIDVTHFQSTSEEYLADIPSNGEITLKCNFLAKTGTSGLAQKQLQNDGQGLTGAPPIRDFKIILNTQTPKTEVQFIGFVKGFSISSQKGDAYRADVTIKISGGLTWTNQ
jgi:hypothetical protein